MSRTYSDVITRARRILQDENASNYRYSDQSLVDAANDAVLEVRRTRPDLMLRVSFNPSDVTLADIALVSPPVEDMYFQSLVYITVGYQMLRDDEFSKDSRAIAMLNKGLSQLLTVAS